MLINVTAEVIYSIIGLLVVACRHYEMSFYSHARLSPVIDTLMTLS